MNSITRKSFIAGAASVFAAMVRVASFAGQTRKQKTYDDTTWLDPYVGNITDSDTYLRRKFRQDVTDKTTGVDVNAVRNICTDIIAAGKASGESWRITKARLFAAQAPDRGQAGFPRRGQLRASRIRRRRGQTRRLQDRPPRRRKGWEDRVDAPSMWRLLRKDRAC